MTGGAFFNRLTLIPGPSPAGGRGEWRALSDIFVHAIIIAAVALKAWVVGLGDSILDRRFYSATGV
jgi:hypothetical protein